MSKLLWVPLRHTTLRINPEASITSGLLRAIIHLKDISATLSLLPLWSPYLLRVFSTLRPSMFRRFHLQTWSSNNRYLIPLDSYATPSCLTFITCVTALSARAVIHSGRYPACNPNQPASVIMAVTTNPARADHAVTIIYQFRPHANIHVRYILSVFSKETEIVFLNLRIHTVPHWQFPLPVHHQNILAIFFCPVIPSFHLLILTLKGLGLAPYRYS